MDVGAGARNRGEFIREAIALKLHRQEQAARLGHAVGARSGVDIPGGETEESTLGWVRMGRLIGLEYPQFGRIQAYEEDGRHDD